MSAYHKYAYHYLGEKMTFEFVQDKKFRVNERQRNIVLVKNNNISRQIVYKIKMINGTLYVIDLNLLYGAIHHQ